MVTCARTRGSMMKFLPVAAATASAICVMSASLKLGVMRCACGACCACCACCAEASEAAARTASAHTANERKPVTGSTPRKKRAGRLLVAAVPARHFGGRRHLRHGHRRPGHRRVGGRRGSGGRRVGEEGRSRGAPYHLKKKKKSM